MKSVALLLCLVAASACAKPVPPTSDEPGPDDPPPREAGVMPTDAQSSVSAPSEAGVIEAGVVVAPPTLLGINAPDVDNQLIADLEVAALAPHATSVVARGADEASIDAALERAATFQRAGVRVVFSIDVARGRRAYVDLGSDEQRDALLAAVDRVFASGLPIVGLVLGEGLDEYLSHHPGAGRERLDALVREFLTHGANHPERLPETRVSVHTTPGAWTRVTSELEAWAQLSDAFCISWFAVGETGRAIDSIRAGETLAEMLDRAPDSKKPVLIREVAYPSAAIVESSFERQSRFFSGLLPVLAARPLRVPLLSVSALRDPSEEECQSYIEDYGLPSSAGLARCSVGLLGSTGEPKPAFYTLLDAFATSNLRER